MYIEGNGSNSVNDGYGVVDGSMKFHDKWTSADFFGSYFVGLWYFDNSNLLGEFFCSSFQFKISKGELRMIDIC